MPQFYDSSQRRHRVFYTESDPRVLWERSIPGIWRWHNEHKENEETNISIILIYFSIDSHVLVLVYMVNP